MITYRQGRSEDVQRLLELIKKGFSLQETGHNEPWEGETHYRLFSYLYSIPSWNPEWITLAEDGVNLIAVVGFFPHILKFEGITLPAWAVSPVVTHPDFRSQGLAGNCLEKGMANLAQQGIPAVFLWGLPGYYPRFGFVPALPRYKTRINHALFRSQGASIISGCFRKASRKDNVTLARLYETGSSPAWLRPFRDAAWWGERLAEMGIEDAGIREVPFPEEEKLLLWENHSDGVSGYLCYQMNPARQRCYIQEAFCRDEATAYTMLKSFLESRLTPGFELLIRGTPEHLLNASAYRCGGTHIDPLPQLGMFKVIDWKGFAERLAPLFEKRFSFITDNQRILFVIEQAQLVFQSLKNGIKIKVTGEISPKTNTILTRLFLGIYDEIDLGQVEGDLELLRLLFPKKHPFVWDANYLY